MRILPAPPRPPDLSRRDLRHELMDDPALDPAEHERALGGLRLLNRASLTAATLWKCLRALAPRSGDAPLRVLDIATGSGDIPLALARRAHRAGLAMAVDGCDISPRALALARARAAGAGARAGFLELDAVHGEPPEGYDVLMCSLFMHHLREDDVVTLLAKMRRAARRMVLVSDLHRCRMGYVLALLASRVFSRSRVVHVDALLSVRAAFTPAEFAALARRAGLEGARVRRCWPQRFLLEWHAPGGGGA